MYLHKMKHINRIGSMHFVQLSTPLYIIKGLPNRFILPQNKAFDISKPSKRYISEYYIKIIIRTMSRTHVSCSFF